MSNPQGVGGPIEEQAAAAIGHEGNPVEHYAKEAAEMVGANTRGTPAQQFMKAQQRFISSQTRFIHEKDPIQMLGAHLEFIVELLEFVAASDHALALTLGERYITDMQGLLVDRSLI